MNIGIIGAGNLGTGLVKRLSAKGHAVMLSFSRDPGRLSDIAQAFGARAGTPAEAAEFGETAVLAVPWAAVPEALRQAGNVAGKKPLWDCTNALTADMSDLAIGFTTSAGEEAARLAPWALVVKGIPPFAETLHSSSPAIGGAYPDVFLCGDDDGARKTIATLVEDIGASPVDAGLCGSHGTWNPPACSWCTSPTSAAWGPESG